MVSLASALCTYRPPQAQLIEGTKQKGDQSIRVHPKLQWLRKHLHSLSDREASPTCSLILPFHPHLQALTHNSGKPVTKLPEELPLPSTATSSDLYTQLATSSRTSIHRLRITKGSDGTYIPNIASLPISETGLRDGSTIYVKDLGTPSSSLRLSSPTQSTRKEANQPSRPPNILAPRLHPRIPRPPPHPPAPLLPPPITIQRPIIPPDPLLRPHNPALPETRAGNPLRAPLLRRHDAAVQPLQE